MVIAAPTAITADFVLDTIEVVAKDGSTTPTPSATTIGYQQLSVQPVNTPKDIASAIPNLVMPAYGSAMTSTIYIRGLGSRLDQPVIQILIDGVPVLDKNAFDSEPIDLRRVTFRAGSQGTLYGRNSMGGVMEFTTFQPMDVAKWGVRASVGYSSANSVDVRASVYHSVTQTFGYSIGVLYGRIDGFYRNDYTGKLIDGNYHASGRFVMQFKPNPHWSITATTMASWIKQGAFPYAAAETGLIAYNSPASYERLLASQSVRATYNKEGYRLALVGSYQFLKDHMVMDQDYTPASIFTLEQRQQQHNAYIDAILNGKRPVSWYNYSVGATVYLKHNTMNAPVTFLREGIETLILSNANKGIHTAFPNDSLEISNTEIAIPSDFRFMNFAGAAYHQSTFTPVAGLRIEAGLRVDIEYSSMEYQSSAELDYRMTAFMAAPEHYRNYMAGFRSQTHVALLPKLLVRYDWDKFSIYASTARGSKAGGYNPQIFSTIMQTRLMNGLMEEMGVRLMPTDDGINYGSADITAYKPETAWTTEFGGCWNPLRTTSTNNHRLSLNALAFYSDVQNQQVTVFPSGKTSGRMMSNAAHARSIGVEATFNYRYQDTHWQVEVHTVYGFTDARFIRFDNGMGVYDGKFVPYAPQHTFSAQATGRYRFTSDWALSLTLSTRGQGRTYWDENNTVSQSYYQLLDLAMNLSWRQLNLQFWGRNIVGTEYDVFYFVSMSNGFLQKGIGRQLGVSLSWSL